MTQHSKHDWSEHHRRRAEQHVRAAQAARTAGERLMHEELAESHSRLAAAPPPRASARGR